jgi:glycosyltransferase involved in cell wall biosynthesis
MGTEHIEKIFNPVPGSCDLIIYILTYNHENYIRECLDSVIGQTTKYTFRILATDDNSTDNTQQILLEYQKKYPDMIDLILRKKNSGGGRLNFLEGLLEIKHCKYIATLDGDDLWYDGKIEESLNVLEKYDDVSVVHTNMKKVDPLRTSFLGLFNSPEQKSLTDISDLIFGNYVCNSSKIFRYEDLPKDELLMHKTLVHNGDYILLIQILKHKKLFYLEKIFGEYRVHDSGASRLHVDEVWRRYYGNRYAIKQAKPYIDADLYQKAIQMVRFLYAKLYFLRYDDSKRAKKLLKKIKMTKELYLDKELVLYIQLIDYPKILKEILGFYKRDTI